MTSDSNNILAMNCALTIVYLEDVHTGDTPFLVLPVSCSFLSQLQEMPSSLVNNYVKLCLTFQSHGSRR